MAGLDETARRRLEALGGFIREQRQTAELSLRELAVRTNVSNPYLSQVERGLHEPSVRVLKAIAGALNLSAETLLVQAGLIEDGDGDDGAARAARRQARATSTETVIGDDPRLTAEQRTALLTVYRAYVSANESADTERDATAPKRPATKRRPAARSPQG